MKIHDNITYFNQNDNVSFYDTKEPRDYDIKVLAMIKNDTFTNFTLVDIGGGSGTFSKLIKNNCKYAEVITFDPSKKLLECGDKNVIKVIGGLPGPLPFKNKSIDFVIAKVVLHHIVGNTVRDSKMLVGDSFKSISEVLKKEGKFIIHDIYYETYLSKGLTSHIIFYICLLQNILGIKLPIGEFREGLKVYFYSRDEMKKLLHENGFEVVDYFETKWKGNKVKKLLLLKEWGNMFFICRPIYYSKEVTTDR
jgi:ubiquinone/menaquinone biosynthesis C-methylase UbiE